jgi:hypothetical protein
VLLYDLTSTYIEGEGEEIPKAQYGYSRDRLHKLKLELPQQPPPRIKTRVPEFPPEALCL